MTNNIFADNLDVDLNQIRNVIPSQKEATNILIVDNYQRPFKLQDAQQLMEKFGVVKQFWMDQFKRRSITHFETVEQCQKARDSIYNLVWPRSGNPLKADYLQESEVQQNKEAQVLEIKNIVIDRSQSKTNFIVKTNDQTQKAHKNSEIKENEENFQKYDRQSYKQYESKAEKKYDLKFGKKIEKNSKQDQFSLDDLFKKTKTKPYIYYLPLTQQQVDEKEKVN